MLLAELNLESPSESDPRWAFLDEQKQQLEQDAMKYADMVQEALRAFLDKPIQFEENCTLLYEKALAGKALEVQAVRERLLTAFLYRLFLLNKALTMARHAEHVARRILPEAGQIEAEAKTLDQQIARLMVRWQTPEDLENLAAQSLLPSSERMAEIRQKCAPPQEWYDEVGKPF